MLVSFGNVIDDEVNKNVISLYHAVCKNPFTGFTEAVPAYSSLAIFYDVFAVRQNNPSFDTAFDAVEYFIRQIISTGFSAITSSPETIIIPVLYTGEDLEIIAEEKNISVDVFIKIHAAKIYRVYMIGFIPGFAYMGSVDERIVTPRKQVPRTQVPAGSVGIAGKQTGIYPLVSPGGWQLIGQTPLKIFNKEKETPCLLKAGDAIQFVSISKKEFDQLNEY